MTASTPSHLEGHTVYWLRCLSNFVSSTFADRVEAHGVSVAQWVVLRTLFDRPDVTLNEAAGVIGVDNSTLSRMVERLVQKDLVVRVTDLADRRAVRLRLTPQGSELVPVLARLADDNDAQFFKPLTPEAKAAFLSTLHLLLAANGWERGLRGRDQLE